EFWATAKLHHNSIRFKIDTRKSVLDLEAFREMLHISPRIPNQLFADLPTEEEVLDFLRHQATQQYGAILPIELTSIEIRNSKAYQEYFACAMGEAAPKPKASARKKKGDSASSTTPPTPTPTTTAESALRLSASAKGTGKGTCSKPGVPDVPSDDLEEELSWKSSDDEEAGGHEEDKESDDDSDKDSDETVKSGAGKEGDEDDD
nr:hypothetical protein [Tanacetum cinerariifolium]